jgi:four helix bundle protein
MATIMEFDEIEAWQKARELTRAIYSCSNSGPFARDFGLRDHIREAAISIMSNIAEGFERGGNREFVQFLAVARGSAGEVESKLYVALDQGYVSEQEFGSLRETTRAVKRMISGLMNYLRRSGLRGLKYAASLDASDRPPHKPGTRN